MTAVGDLAADREARRLAQEEFTLPLVLEAGAGTGKTTTLVARVLAWCLGPGWQRSYTAEAEAWERSGRRGTPPAVRVAARTLDGVVAITFTEAAAAEMAQRASRELTRLADPGAELPRWLLASLPDPGERVRRAGALLAALDHLVVRTIHAWCRGLLAENPLAADLHPDLAVDPDGALVEEVAREVVEGSLRESYGEDAAGPHLPLAARGFGPRELVEALTVLATAGLPGDTLEGDFVGPEATTAFRRRLAAACRDLAAAAEPLRGSQRSPVSRATAEAATVLAAEVESAAGLEEILAAARAVPDNVVDRLRKWARPTLNETEKELLAGREAPLARCAAEAANLVEHARALDLGLLDLARRVLAPLHAAVRRELRSRGVATFEDLLAETADLLRRRPDVRRRIRSRIDQLLVDEFQDTDRLQCEIVGLLALDGPVEERPGLFLVGDPKQSIYGWRNADLVAYDDFVERAAAAGGRRLPLVENFRSVPAILDEVTRVVEPVMSEERGLQPRFQRLVACAALAGAPGFSSAEPGVRRGPVEHWVSWRPPRGADDRRSAAATTVEAAAALEADAIAHDLRDLHDNHGVGWGEAALLLRSTNGLELYLEALRRARVPFAVGRDTQYYQRREVIEAAALVRCVLDPGDHVALLTLLRSATVGVPDAALLPLWRHRLPALMTDLSAPRPEQLAAVAEAVARAARDLPRDIPGLDRVAGWDASLVAAAGNLARARESFRRDPADVFVATLRELFLVEPTEAARYLGAYRLANLDRFFRRLTAALDEGGGDAAALLRALRRAIAEAREADEAKPREGADEAVQVMTIHQAKGLDFAHVYLPQLHREGGGDRGGPKTEVARTPDGFELRLFGAPTLGFDRVAAHRARVEAAERVRLLYVAMTRAEVRVVLAGCWPAEPAAVDVDRARTHVQLLGHRGACPPLGEHWQSALRAAAGDPAGAEVAAASGAALLDDAGVLWRFPALEAWPPVDVERADGPDLPDPDHVAEQARSLARRRGEAARRMARPFSAAASEEAHHRLREAAGEGAAGGDAGTLARETAMAAGTAIHRALEELDPTADGAGEMERLRQLLPVWVAQAAPAAAFDAARAEAEEILARLAGGRLLARLRSLAPHTLARELPVLLAPSGEGEPRAGDDAPPPPVGFVSGAIDLLYRDPTDGELVVVDYKTDAVATEEQIRGRAGVYRPQGAVYARAVQEGLGLPRPPRVELWFLRADRAWPLEPAAGGGPAPPAPPAAPQLPEIAPSPVQGTLFDL